LSSARAEASRGACDGVERPWLERQLALQQPHGFELERRERHVLAVRLVVGRGLAVRAGVLVQLERGQRAHDVAVGLAPEELDGRVDAEPGERRDEEREPEIEVVVAPVVLRDAGMRVDGGGRFVHANRIDAGSDEARPVPERSRVELCGKLTDDAFASQALGALDDFLLGHVQALSDERERR
jgi:hypothetical protein